MPMPDALESLRHGGFVILHDSENRENEFDLVVAAQFVTPAHISTMRMDAGGLLCAALDHDLSCSLGLTYLHDILAKSSIPGEMILGKAPYGDHPTFAIPVNHMDTYTGVTDNDRARTIRELSTLYGKDDSRRLFIQSFRTPGHVPLLMASRIEERMGHTEMSVFLARLAGLKPVTAICEMVDSETHMALDLDGATSYAKKNNIPLVMASDIPKHAGVDAS